MLRQNKRCMLISIAFGFVVPLELGADIPKTDLHKEELQREALSDYIINNDQINVFSEYDISILTRSIETNISKLEKKVLSLPVDVKKRRQLQFKINQLKWVTGKQDALMKNEMLEFIRRNVDKTEAVDFFYNRMCLQPFRVKTDDPIILYSNKPGTNIITAVDPNLKSLLTVTETRVPAEVYNGRSALRVEWSKNSPSWASLIIGIDPNIADSNRAKNGLMNSLDIDRSNADEHVLEFAIRGQLHSNRKGSRSRRGRTSNWVYVKLQDQNLLFEESIGNQLVHEVRVSDDWKTHRIRFTDFKQDYGIRNEYHKKYFRNTGYFRRLSNFKALEFDWTRVKQINFDIPYFSSGSGTLWIDNIIITRPSGIETTRIMTK